MCKYTRTTVRYRCHDVSYTKVSECQNARYGRSCHREDLEESYDEPRKLCRDCEEARDNEQQATVAADLQNRTRALDEMDMRDKGKGKASGEYSDHNESGSSASRENSRARARAIYRARERSESEDAAERYSEQADPSSAVEWVDNPNPGVERWMDKVSNPDSRNSAYSEERRREIAAFRVGEDDDRERSTYSRSDYTAWTSGDEDLEVTPVTREERREIWRRYQEREEEEEEERRGRSRERR